MEEFNQYQYLSKVYDLFNYEIDYDSWANFIEKEALKSNFEVIDILDVGAGSGNITKPLLDKGFHVVAIDSSEEMLENLREKTADNDNLIIISQDINEGLDFEIYEIDMIISTNEVINYITDEKVLKDYFKFAYDHMREDGLFIFDIASEYKYKNTLKNSTIVKELDDCYLVWQNFLEDNILTMDLDIFLYNEENDMYERYYEQQYQRVYKTKEIVEYLKEAGFKDIQIYDDYKYEKIENSQRLVFVVRK